MTEQKPLAFKIPRAFVGALALVLEDSEGHRLAANFVNLVITPETPAPRVERVDDHHAVVRFSPGEVSSAKFKGGSETLPGKVWGRGPGSFTYKLKLPETILKARPKGMKLSVEAAAKGGRDQVDWNERTNAQDNPQTDERKNPSSLVISIGGKEIGAHVLPDDPADARGVLSHLRRTEHGGYGYPLADGIGPEEIKDMAIEPGKPLEVTFAASADGHESHGLSLYGAESGAYPYDPTLTIETEDALPEDLGVKPGDSVAVDLAAARKIAVLRAGDSNAGPPTVWSYTTDDPGDGWNKEEFDASAWKQGPAGFGTPETPALQDKTLWDTPSIWLRTVVEVPELADGDALSLHLFHDEDIEIFINGQKVFAASGFSNSYGDAKLGPEARKAFHPGKNTVAARCRQTQGGQGIDLGLSILRAE